MMAKINDELGNKPYPFKLMLRNFILQNVYDFADMAVINEVVDSRTFFKFLRDKFTGWSSKR